MIATRVGYAGGRTSNPTYHDLADHTEALQVTFDAGRLSFDYLLELFWGGHNPTRPNYSTQYRAALFAEDTSQIEHFRQSAEREAERRGAPVTTAIVDPVPFYDAEGYHQKWYLRRHPQVFEQLVARYPDEESAVASTAAARLNGYLGGAGTAEQLARDIHRIGLDESAQRYVYKTCGIRSPVPEPAAVAALAG